MPTTGLQLIASGHSLTDAYMAFDVDEYAALYQLTGDAHLTWKGVLRLPRRMGGREAEDFSV